MGEVCTSPYFNLIFFENFDIIYIESRKGINNMKYLVRKQYTIDGIDKSAEVLHIANSHAAANKFVSKIASAAGYANNPYWRFLGDMNKEYTVDFGSYSVFASVEVVED